MISTHAEAIGLRLDHILHAANSQSIPGLHASIVAAYSEPWRHYHTLEHLVYGYEVADNLVDVPWQVGLAYMLHDVVYDPGRYDNERKSGEWAQPWVKLIAPGEWVTLSDRIGKAIYTTKHTKAPSDPWTRLLCDMDLAILGGTPEEFARFEADIRSEYAFVDEVTYRRLRSLVLQGFLDRSNIYCTDEYIATREQQARENLAGLIASLAG